MVSTRWGNIEMGDCVAICVNRNESFRWGTYFTAKYANSGVQLCEIVAQKKKKKKKKILFHSDETAFFLLRSEEIDINRYGKWVG